MRIELALKEEHVRYDESRKRRTRYSVERVCVGTGIPFDTMNAYVQGKRLPGILDMREICAFADIRFEELMSVIPSRKELDTLYDDQKRRVLEEARRRDMGEDEDDDE